jgi:hypothetical protein
VGNWEVVYTREREGCSATKLMHNSGKGKRVNVATFLRFLYYSQAMI